MMISIIVAIGKNRELGKNNKLLWNIPEDLKRFKKITSDNIVVMGRKTYESIGRPLKNRINIVITRDREYKVEGAVIVHSLEEAIKKLKDYENKNVFIIGGGQIYNQAIEIADRLYITLVDEVYPEADTYFPEYVSFFPKLITTESSRYGDIDVAYEVREKK